MAEATAEAMVEVMVEATAEVTLVGNVDIFDVAKS